MRGEIDTRQLPKVEDSQLLCSQMQYFYLSPEALEVVKTFHLKPNEFDYNKVIQMCPAATGGGGGGGSGGRVGGGERGGGGAGGVGAQGATTKHGGDL